MKSRPSGSTCRLAAGRRVPRTSNGTASATAPVTGRAVTGAGPRRFENWSGPPWLALPGAVLRRTDPGGGRGPGSEALAGGCS